MQLHPNFPQVTNKIPPSIANKYLGYLGNLNFVIIGISMELWLFFVQMYHWLNAWMCSHLYNSGENVITRKWKIVWTIIQSTIFLYPSSTIFSWIESLYNKLTFLIICIYECTNSAAHKIYARLNCSLFEYHLLCQSTQFIAYLLCYSNPEKHWTYLKNNKTLDSD